jgi:hypothetical protein
MFEAFELMLRLTESTVKNENETVESGLVNINFVVVEARGLEPLTPCLQSRCSPIELCPHGTTEIVPKGLRR